MTVALSSNQGEIITSLPSCIHILSICSCLSLDDAVPCLLAAGKLVRFRNVRLFRVALHGVGESYILPQENLTGLLSLHITARPVHMSHALNDHLSLTTTVNFSRSTTCFKIPPLLKDHLY